jgi:hypothetical protein
MPLLLLCPLIAQFSALQFMPMLHNKTVISIKVFLPVIDTINRVV